MLSHLGSQVSALRKYWLNSAARACLSASEARKQQHEKWIALLLPLPLPLPLRPLYLGGSSPLRLNSSNSLLWSKAPWFNGDMQRRGWGGRGRLPEAFREVAMWDKDLEAWPWRLSLFLGREQKGNEALGLQCCRFLFCKLQSCVYSDLSDIYLFIFQLAFCLCRRVQTRFAHEWWWAGFKRCRILVYGPAFSRCVAAWPHYLTCNFVQTSSVLFPNFWLLPCQEGSRNYYYYY